MKSIEDIMSKKVITAESNTEVEDAAKLLEKYKIGSLIITEGKKTVGIVTERDITYRYVAKQKEIGKKDILLKDIMSSPLITLSMDNNPNVMDAIVIMHKHKIKRICIIKKGKLIGVLAELDLFKDLAESYVNNLKKMITRL